MKKIIAVLLSFIVLQSYSQEFDGHKWEAPYHLPTPAGWGVERFPLPASFAPEIKYKGVEDIRFAPGWAKSSTSEYWSYSFLWFLDGQIDFTTTVIEQNLKAYYTGLLKVNSDPAKHANEAAFIVITKFEEAKADENFLQSFRGTVTMRDYMTRQPITLNCIVKIRRCEANKTFAFFTLSPRPFTDSVWIPLNNLLKEFKCSK